MYTCICYNTGGGYGSGPYNVTFPAGMITALLNVSITDDGILENNKTFFLVIDIYSLPANVFTGNTNQTIVNILNDDGKDDLNNIHTTRHQVKL